VLWYWVLLGLAAGAVKVALQGRGSFSRRSGPEAALGVVFFDDPPRHADV
jgi:hypothetical protein